MKRVQLLKELMRKLENGFDNNRVRTMTVMISKGLHIDKQDQKLIFDFCDMCANMLDLAESYECYLSSDRKKSKIVTTAICDFDRNNIRIYCHQRALVDILRSIAHEMYHLRQCELDLVPKQMKQHYLNPIEWHANVAAGSLLSFYAQKVGKDKIYR